MISKINEKIEAGYYIGIVGGGTFEKAISQLGSHIMVDSVEDTMRELDKI